MDSILETIDQALRQKGLTDAAASKLAVGHPSLIKNLRMPRDGEKRYNLPSLIRLAEVLDLEFYFGPRRASELSPSAVISNHQPEDDAPSGFLTIPWAEGGIKKGSAPVAFSRAWLAQHSLVPDFLAVASPDIVVEVSQVWEDHLALLDVRAGLRKGHDLWCYRMAGKVLVSYITFKGDVTVVHPAEPSAEPRIFQGPPIHAINILGKVVWLGESVPLKANVG
jgi:hypothetical protein